MEASLKLCRWRAVISTLRWIKREAKAVLNSRSLVSLISGMGVTYRRMTQKIYRRTRFVDLRSTGCFANTGWITSAFPTRRSDHSAERFANGPSSGTGSAARVRIHYTFSGTIAQFAVGQSSPGFEWKIDLEVTGPAGLPRNAVQPAPQGQLGLGANYYAGNDAKRSAAFIFREMLTSGSRQEKSSILIGRFQFADGGEATPVDPTLVALKRDRISQRLIGIFGYTDVQRSFDGVNAVYSHGPWTIDAAGAIPTRGVFQVDGWGWVKTPFAYASLTRQVTIRRETRRSGDCLAFSMTMPSRPEDGQPVNRGAYSRRGSIQSWNLWRPLHPGYSESRRRSRSSRLGRIAERKLGRAQAELRRGRRRSRNPAQVFSICSSLAAGRILLRQR